MSILLFSIGALAVIAGTAMVGFGLPVAEFSFGNTLILAGSTTAVGGLVVIGLGAVVSKLQQIMDSLAAGPVRPADAFDAGLRGAPAPGRIPVRPKAKGEGTPEVRQIPPTQAARPVDEPLPPPTLRNPELPPVPSEDEVSLSPHYPSGSDSDVGDLGVPARPVPPEPPVQARKESRFDRPRRPLATPTRPSGGGYFDAVWPRKSARTPASETPAEPPVDQPLPDRRAELPRADTTRAESFRVEPAQPDSPRDTAGADHARDLRRPGLTQPDRADVDLPREADLHGTDGRSDFRTTDADRTERAGSNAERTGTDESAPDAEGRAEASKTPAVLKSGVVDGMGYTLYVDGSIEAELPEGTLRFASINELRSHLEKNA